MSRARMTLMRGVVAGALLTGCTIGEHYPPALPVADEYRNLISAARSLGCTGWQAFKEVTLPLSLPGLGAGLLLSFVLAAGSYVTPQILGGRRDSLFGNLIYDTIMGFDAAMDTIDVVPAVVGIDTEITEGFLSLASFDQDLKKMLRQFDAGNAVLLTADTGDLAGEQFLIVDLDGNAGYRAGRDLVLHLDSGVNLGALDIGDFV